VIEPRDSVPAGQARAASLLLTVTPIQDESGSPSGAVVVIRDMSAIKRLEEQVRRTEKLAAVGRLAAGVAHEIRNPLSSIRGFAYLLGRGHGKDTPEREYADVMVREIDRINHVVTDLLNFSRPMALEPEVTMLPDLIDHVVSLVSADAKKHEVDINVDCTSGIPPCRWTRTRSPRPCST
jgi:two-component system sensor histidine kinase HydH